MVKKTLDVRGYPLKRIVGSRHGLWVMFECGGTDTLPLDDWRSDMDRCVHRQKWIRRRNLIESALGKIGVRLERRCDSANRIMGALGFKPPKLNDNAQAQR